ncbi:hypothetical protein D3C76_857300 [compost metagenome]
MTPRPSTSRWKENALRAFSLSKPKLTSSGSPRLTSGNSGNCRLTGFSNSLVFSCTLAPSAPMRMARIFRLTVVWLSGGNSRYCAPIRLSV